jgi:hypothetical protein
MAFSGQNQGLVVPGAPRRNVSAPRVLHLPEVGVVRDIPRALKIVAAVLLMIVTVPP